MVNLKILMENFIFHMTHIENLQTIFEHGLLPHNNLYKKHDISNIEVNCRRRRLDPIYKRSLHDYVPFYFNPRNAMLYSVQYKYKDEIVILKFRRDILKVNGVIFSNANAATNNTCFRKNIYDLYDSNFISWDEVYADSWDDKDEGIKTYKSQKMQAEVLIPDMVPSAMIAGIVCQNPSVCQKVAKLLNNSINISWNSSFFFNISNDNTPNQKREFKHDPQTKDDLQALVNNEDIYLGDIDTSVITDMSKLFFKGHNKNRIIINERENFDGIELWNVSNVTNMSRMFWGCKNFNQPLIYWNVSNVTNMSYMFCNCENFNQTLDFWNVSNVTDMSYMFCNCENFNQTLNSWDVTNVTNMSCMFWCCKNFNQPLNFRDVSNVTDMSYMFLGCKNFNQPLNSWDVTNVTNMSKMFLGCENFNQPLNSWNIDDYTNTEDMFDNCNIDEKNLPNFT